MARFVEVSDELAEMAKTKILPDLVSDREGALLEELDRIEFELGADYLDQRKAGENGTK